VRLARSIIDGSMPVLLGCRKMVGPISRLGLDREDPFATFGGVGSETDHLPLDPEERKLWRADVLVEKDREIARFTAWAQGMVRDASEAVVRRLGDRPAGWQVPLEADDTWLCRHVDAQERPAAATRLRLDQTRELNPGVATSAPRRWVECPDCGTHWRVWVGLRVAKPAVERVVTRDGDPPRRYRRAPVRDVDRIIDAVARELPDVGVVQWWGVWPADDEGLWYFDLPGVRERIQIESSEGACPFLVEHDGMRAGGGWTARTVGEAVRMVVDYLRGRQGRRAE